jgi:hypothetical protein
VKGVKKKKKTKERYANKRKMGPNNRGMRGKGKTIKDFKRYIT